MNQRKGILELQNNSEYTMLFCLSWPIVLSLFVQGMYSLVDSIFLSRLGEETLSAISLSFVVQNFASAMYAGIATGINAVVSRALGAKEFHKAKNFVISGAYVQLGLVVILIGIGIWGVPFYFAKSTANAAVSAIGLSYLTPCLIFSIFSGAQITSERLLQSTGQSRYMLFSQITGTAVNSVLDPILIFGLFGLPSLGARGAAYATIIGQSCAALIALFLTSNAMVFYLKTS